MIFFNIENITFYITSAFSIYLLLITSECQAPIIFLFADENIKCGYSFSFIDSFHKKRPAGLELESLAQKSIALTNRLGKPLILPVYQNDT